MLKERQGGNVGETKRTVNPGAEAWLGEVIPVLDHGFVRLVDYMGDDESIEQAARVSYGEGTRRVSETRGLIRYLRRHAHTTPFEMVEFKFHAKMPIFVARQWIRHRTASVNEYSARYSKVPDEFYIPNVGVIGAQSKNNKQGRDDVFDAVQAEEVRQLLIADALRNYGHYEYMLNDDGEGNPVDSGRPMLARELARMDLTLNSYTQWYWKVDLHNLFHFLRLRMDSHAQYEIRVYADAMGRIVRDSMPIAWDAFEDYELFSVKFTRPELEVLKALLQQCNFKASKADILTTARETGLTNRRERDELLEKLDNLGFVGE